MSILTRVRTVAAVTGIVAGTIMSGAGLASAEPTHTHDYARVGWVAEDHSVVPPGYYSDPTTVEEYTARLNRPGACRIASSIFAKWRPGDPPVAAKITRTMATCLATP